MTDPSQGYGLNTAIPEISTGLSLGVIIGVLTIIIVASRIKSRRDPLTRICDTVVAAPHYSSEQRNPDPDLHQLNIANAAGCPSPTGQ